MQRARSKWTWRWHRWIIWSTFRSKPYARVLRGWLALVLSFVCIDSAHAQVSFSEIPNQIPVGTRPRSLAEAFTAVADDGYAAYWNPAGMARLDGLRLTLSYSDLYNFDIDNLYGSVTTRPYLFPQLIDYAALGTYWNIIQSIDSQTGQKDFDRSQFGFSLALQPPRAWPWLYNLRAGATAKYFQESISYPTNNGPVPQGDYGGWGFDLGLLYGFDDVPFLPNGLTFGLMIHDLGGTSVKHPGQNGKRFEETISSQTTHWALSYRPFEDWPGGDFPLSEPLFAVELDDRVHLGMELVLAKTLALRGGLQWSRNSEERGTSLAFGLGVKKSLWGASRRFEFDYAATDSPVLPNTNTQFGGALVFDENPRLVRFQVAEINDIFASLYKRYASEAGELGRVVLYNRHDDSLLVDVTFRAAPYTRDPVPQTVVVPAHGIREVALRAFLDREIIGANSRQRKTGTVVAEYSVPYRGSYATTKNVKYTLHGAGYLTWDDVGKVAAFVTKYDRCINEFAKGVVTQEVSSDLRINFFSRNMRYALAIYEALNAMGFRWVSDAKTPFAEVGQTQQVVDQIRYPADLLSSQRAGDCDDLSVLYATLLESIGVETALLVTPRHLFAMLNTDIPARRLNSMPVPASRFIAHRGTLWLPVETTMFPASFATAWREGASSAHAAWRADTLEIVDIALDQSVDRYEPADVEFPKCRDLQAPAVADRVRSNLAVIDDTIKAFLRVFEDDLILDPGNIKRRNAYAAILGQNGAQARARLELQQALSLSPQNAPTLNNLGNLELVARRYAAAESLYTKSLQHNPYNQAGTYLNLAILYAMQIPDEPDETEQASEFRNKCLHALREARRRLTDDPESAMIVLGLTQTAPAAKGGKAGIDQQPQQISPSPDSVVARQDSIRYTPNDRSNEGKGIAGLISFITTAWESLIAGPESQGAVPDYGGPKGSIRAEEDLARLLWWDA